LVENDKKLLLKLDDAAKLLGLSRAKAYQMAQTGEMPGVVRMGRTVRVSDAALRSWIEGRIEGPHGEQRHAGGGLSISSPGELRNALYKALEAAEHMLSLVRRVIENFDGGSK
jgi:excisionase family DNA binding protein